MDVIRIDGVIFDKDPAVGIIILEDSSSAELDTLMNTIMGKGIPDDNVHTLFFKDLDIGVVKIEPNPKIVEGRRGKRITDEINEIVGTFHETRSYICLWSYFETCCSLVDDRIVWFRSERYDEHSMSIVIEFHHPNKSEPMDLARIRLTDESS